MDRRSLLDGDGIPSQARGDVFGDEFEADYEFDGIADGFRPHTSAAGGEETGRVPHPSQDQVDNRPIRTISAHYSSRPVTPSMSTGETRNSVRKSTTYANPFSSPEDDGPRTPTRRGGHSLEFEPDDIVRRSISSASSSQFAPTHSPRFGAGPSHPYAIYPQGTMARTPSLATQSTVRAPSQRQSFSQSQPQHPYAMYPQGVGEDMMEDDEEEDFALQQNPVPVGFPGLGGGYTRRIGPDGEDQDLIGADGHTEQLPPYSRYPEDGPEKAPLLIPTALHSRAPVAGTDPSMPLMHDMPQAGPQYPAPQSMTDDSQMARNSVRGSTSHLVPSRSSSISTSRHEKKPWGEKTWKEKRKTRFCGVAFQWILLAGCVLVFIGAVLGGGIGGFVAGGQHAREQAPTVTVVTSLYDASLIASPTSGAPPTGSYALALGQPQETQNACLANKGEKVAWSCDVSPNAGLGIAVGVPRDGQGSGAHIFYGSSDSDIGYGAQLSSMKTKFAQFLTVQDNDDKQNGPAFYFQTFYDKVVVVPEDAIELSKNKKRGRPSDSWKVPEGWAHRRQVAQPGEKPWFCVWNGTFLEGFIYVTETMAIPTPTPSSTVTETASPSYPASTSAAATTSGISGDSYRGTPTTTATSETEPPDHITKTWTATGTTTATFTGPASDLNQWMSTIIGEANNRVKAAGRPGPGGGPGSGPLPPPPVPPTLPPPPPPRRRQDDPFAQLPLFPYLVKLEERRLPNNPVEPYCQQYQILDNGQANWVEDGEKGTPIIVQLEEQDPSYGQADTVTSKEFRRTLEKKRDVPNACHCQWMSGEDLT